MLPECHLISLNNIFNDCMKNKDQNTAKKKKTKKKKAEVDSISELKKKIKHQKNALDKILKHIQDEKKTDN